MDEFSGSGDFLQNLVLGTIWSGVGALSEAAKLGYGYVTDPQNRANTAQNASQFAQNLGKYTPNGREWFFSDPIPNAAAQQKAQFQQLADAKAVRDPTNGRWNVRNQTGFDDERDNVIDDRARSQQSYSQYQQKTGTSNMAYDDNEDDSRRRSSGKTVINSSRPSDYAPGEKLQSDYAGYQIKSLTDLQNYAMQSSDRRYATDRTADVTYKLGSQKNQVDYMVGMDRNAVTRDVGYYTSDNQLRASNYKSYADLQAALNKNQLQSGDNRFETSTKYSTQERINQYNRNTLNKTAIAEAQIKAGTYGLSQNQLSKAAADKTNYDNWKNYNDAMFNYTDRMNAQMKLGQDIAQSQRAYNDQRNDRFNDQSAAWARYQTELAQKASDRNRYYSDLAEQRRLSRDDFNLRSRQIQNQIDIANKDYLIRYGDAKLRQDQFAATRADISYNRSNQSSSLAFQWIELAKNY